MEILLKKGPREEAVKLNVRQGITIEELTKRYQQELPYRILAARVNNELKELTTHIWPRESGMTDRIELMDGRTQAVNLIYQHSLIMIYLKAVDDCLGNVKVSIDNALNQGVFSRIYTPEPVTAEQIEKIEAQMRRIVAENLPYEKQVVPRDQAYQMVMQDGNQEKAKLVNASENLGSIRFYSLGGVRNFFYGLMVPSTGYIEKFELRSYRNGVLLRFPQIGAPDRIPEYVDEVKLYGAFAEQTRWGKLMGVHYAIDLNEKVESGEYRELIQMSEALHEKKIADIADMIAAGGKRMILIAGPSSSGKTTFSKRLIIQMRVNGLDPLYMGTDDYFVERSETPMNEYGEPDYESLNAIDVELFNRNMNDLLSGKEVDLPTFNFLQGKKLYGNRVTSIRKNQPIVIEGIHALNDAMTPLIPAEQKFKIYISPLTQLSIDEHNRIPTTDMRLLRRMVRDNRTRGYSPARTIESWPKVRAGENVNIFPFNGKADVFFNSVHIYELAVLKKYVEPLLAGIGPELPQYSEAVRMLKFIRFFKTIEDDSVIVNNSIIREFIGGSIYDV